jgi:hypothetical protein
MEQQMLRNCAVFLCCFCVPSFALAQSVKSRSQITKLPDINVIHSKPNVDQKPYTDTNQHPISIEYDHELPPHSELKTSFVTVHWFATGPTGSPPLWKVVRDVPIVVQQGPNGGVGDLFAFTPPNSATSICKVTFRIEGLKLMHNYSSECFAAWQPYVTNTGLSIDIEVTTLYK